MLSDGSSYTVLAYSRSRLLNDDCLVAEVFVEPSLFIKSHDLPQDIAEVQREASQEDNASTTSTITEATMGTM